MKRSKIITFILGGVITFLSSSCSSNNVCEIKQKYERIDTVSGMAAFQFYASDTCWDEMFKVGDSLSKIYKKNAYVIVIFSYPEKNIPSFNDGEFSLNTDGTDFEKHFVFGRYFDTSKVFQPILEKTSLRYKEAKELESKGEL